MIRPFFRSPGGDPSRFSASLASAASVVSSSSTGSNLIMREPQKESEVFAVDENDDFAEFYDSQALGQFRMTERLFQDVRHFHISFQQTNT